MTLSIKPQIPPDLRDLPPLVHVATVAAALGVDPRTVRRMLADGRLARACKTHPTGSGRVLIRRDDLLRLVGLEEAQLERGA